MRSRVLFLAPVVVVLACSVESADQAADKAASASPDESATLQSIAAATAKYADVSAALADGFIRDPSGMCVEAAMVGLPAQAGAMGVHYMHPALLGVIPGSLPIDGTDAMVDWAQPEVLVYEPQADGTEKLVAVEYLVFKKAWDDAGHAGPPSFFGNQFVTMADDPNTQQDEAHSFKPHYELHIWTVRDNPTGKYAEFNPAVTCQHVSKHAVH